jgi:hypothetical protein
MEKQINHNVYLKELETALATVKASLINNEEATQNTYKNAIITEKSSENLKKDKKKYLDKATEYYNHLSAMSETAAQVKLLSGRAVTMAKIAATDEETVAKNMAAAAKSIEAAMESIAILSSDAAAINAKAASEDANTKISNMAKEAYTKGLDAAEAAEKATMSSLQATIFSAKSNAKFISTLITDFSTNIDALNTAINTTLTTAKTNVEQASKQYAEAATTSANDESLLEKATLDFNSAKEANQEDKIKLGLNEALKIVKEDKKSTDTSKK